MFNHPQECIYLVDFAFEVLKQPILQILNDPATKITSKPSWMDDDPDVDFYSKPRLENIQYIQFDLDDSIIDTAFFENASLKNQHVRFNLIDSEIRTIIWFYKPIVINDKLVRFPATLWDHRKVKFNPTTQLPPDLQNALLLK